MLFPSVDVSVGLSETTNRLRAAIGADLARSLNTEFWKETPMSTNKNTATEKRDVYETVTSQIISAIEKGVGNWRMPWHTSGRHAFSPINVTSYKPYRTNTGGVVRLYWIYPAPRPPPR